jgi:predicted metal-dependent peptidase
MDYPTLLRVSSDFRQEWYERLEKEVHVLTAEKIYRYFLLQKRDPYLEESLRQEFALCDHSFWERMQDEQGENGQPPSPMEQPDTAQDVPQDNENREVAPLGATNPKEDEWKEHAKRIESEMETFAKDAAQDAGKLSWLLHMQNRRRRSYKEFLKRFSVVREEVSIDMDSFDYGFYMHGLSLYGNMPLIEENEFREVKKVEELVIAIDTSASCKEKLVQQFLNETGAILRSQENFFKKVQIRIIECDNQIQRDVRIDNLDDIETYAQDFQVQGGYGTDFRPVFSYVEELRARGELTNLKGLMYFTDGFGDYPAKPTDYDTVFVFYGDEERDDSHVPGWALTLFLDETT